MQRPLRPGRAGLALLLLSWPVEALAHGFAVRYDLPIPLGFYLAGAGATVVLSFLLLAIFAGESPARADRRPAHLVLRPLGRIVSNRWVSGSLQAISVALFLLVVAAAWFGDINPFKNISTTFVWVIWWVGMMFVNTFDGFLAAPAWTGIYEYLMELGGRTPLWQAPWMTLALKFYLVATPLFLLFPLVFAAAFLVCCRLTAAVAGGAATAMVARYFVLTLLPIAIAYHFAHYLVYLLLAGQYIIPSVSDPFGFGWDLFGTASFKPDIGLIDARFAWYTGVISIVAGHVIAVYLAHRTALRLFSDRRRVLASQFPMLALMVAYTLLSLWIIAQPAVR